MKDDKKTVTRIENGMSKTKERIGKKWEWEENVTGHYLAKINYEWCNFRSFWKPSHYILISL